MFRKLKKDPIFDSSITQKLCKMNTPKTLTDLRFQDNVLNINATQTANTEAHRWFHEVFGYNGNATITVRKLFTEDQHTVYEAYADSGSVDYLYIVQ